RHLSEITVSPSGDAIYQYVDRKGVIHFTNVPTSPRYKQMRGPRMFSHFTPGRLSPTLHRTITQTSRAYRLHPALVRAVIQADSAYDPYARSANGAMGLTLLITVTAS